MTTRAMEGSCLCGAVTIRTTEITDTDACHCGMCRRWGSGPFFSVQCGSDVSFTGEDNIALYDSSDWATRAFCKQCGTHLYYLLKPANTYAVAVGLFQDQSRFRFTEQIFIDRKPHYYEFANQTHTMTEEEVFRKYAPE